MLRKTIPLGLSGIVLVHICCPEVPSDLTFTSIKIVLETISYMVALVVLNNIYSFFSFKSLKCSHRFPQ